MKCLTVIFLLAAMISAQGIETLAADTTGLEVESCLKYSVCVTDTCITITQSERQIFLSNRFGTVRVIERANLNDIRWEKLNEAGE